MKNAERILAALDRRLDHSIELTIFGRAALALAFPHPPEHVERSLDVDGIIPMAELEAFENDVQFWEALEEANRELESDGLYLTHLFQEDQVILAPGWLERRSALTRPRYSHLQLFCPSTSDLVLTKMMRGGDDEDMADIRFLLTQPGASQHEMMWALEHAVVPPVAELQALFDEAREKVLAEMRS